MAELSFAEYLCRGTGPARRNWIGGNWKCNGTTSQIRGIVRFLNNAGQFPLSSEIVICAPAVHLLNVAEAIRKDISIGSEDVGLYGNGAYTGETSAEMLLDVGVKWTLCGHSERRTGFGTEGESSELVAKKAQRALAAGLNVVVCIGETLQDRDAGKTLEVCIDMLTPVCEILDPELWKRVVIAYEPVWAIGTGVVATPAQAEGAHLAIRNWLSEHAGTSIAREVRITYGGSVKGDNCKELIKCPNIDGFLVGGASLLPDFVNIIKCEE
jgi:triosephosphate isomerase (TIM)